MSNKNTQKTHRVPLFKRPIVLVSLAVVLIAAIALTIWAFAHFSHPEPSNPQDPTPSTSSGSNTSQPTDNQTGDEQPTEPERPSQFEGEDPNKLPELTGSITLNTHDSDTLTVAVGIDQYLSEPGTCKLDLLQDGRTLRTVELAAIADVTTSGCGPFSVSISDLSPGTYQLRITISGDDKTGTVNGEVKI